MKFLEQILHFILLLLNKRNSSETYLIELEWEKAIDILNQFQISSNENSSEDEFEKLVDNLEILDNRLVLLNPKISQQRNLPKRRTKTRGSNSQPRLKASKFKVNKQVKTKETTEDYHIETKEVETESLKSKYSLLNF